MNNDELYHYGVLGMKWGVRRYQNENGTLTAAGREKMKKYRSKLATANDHYERAIKNYSKSTDPANNRKTRKMYESLAAYQYGEGLRYTKKASRIGRKISSKNKTVRPSQNQLDRKNEAASLFVKKCMPRRVAEYTANAAYVGAQYVLQKVILGRPVLMISHTNTAYKVKRKQSE